MPSGVVRLCTTRLTVTVTTTACVIMVGLPDLASLDHQQPENQGADPARPEPADEQPAAGGQVAADQRGRHRDQAHHEQRDDGEKHHAPIRIAPSDEHGITAEHREHHQLQQLTGRVGHLRRYLRARPSHHHRVRQAARERGDESAAVQPLSDFESTPTPMRGWPAGPRYRSSSRAGGTARSPGHRSRRCRGPPPERPPRCGRRTSPHRPGSGSFCSEASATAASIAANANPS